MNDFRLTPSYIFSATVTYHGEINIYD